MKKVNFTENQEFGFYSRKLQKPFDTLEELREAEAAYDHVENKADR